MGITFNALSEAVGAEVSGIDLADKIDDATFKEIKKTFHDRGVLLFRNQQLRKNSILTSAGGSANWRYT